MQTSLTSCTCAQTLGKAGFGMAMLGGSRSVRSLGNSRLGIVGIVGAAGSAAESAAGSVGIGSALGLDAWSSSARGRLLAGVCRLCGA